MTEFDESVICQKRKTGDEQESVVSKVEASETPAKKTKQSSLSQFFSRK